MKTKHPRFVTFGPFEADLETGELRREGRRVELQEQPFRVLQMLLERPGELVSREELQERVWPDAVSGDFEQGLNKAVHKLRRALRDASDRPRLVETLARRGYRFIAAIDGVRSPVVAPPPRPQAFRVILDGRSIPLDPGPSVIGRDEAAPVWVDSSTVSRRHARIVVSADAAVLEDLGSKNGTFVAGQRLDAPRRLEDGDEIRVGSMRLVFHTSAGLASTRTETQD